MPNGEVLDGGQRRRPPTVAGLLAFFDAGVEAGTIEGTGSDDRVKSIHRRVFRLTLVAASSLIDGGHRDWPAACWSVHTCTAMGSVGRRTSSRDRIAQSSTP